MKRLLHGILFATIDEVDKLQPGSGFPLIKQGIEDPKKTWKTLLYRVKQYCSCDPQLTGYRLYATIDLDNIRVAHTQIKHTPSNPQWFQSFQLYCAHEVSEIIFTVKDENPVSATLIARAHLPVDELIHGQQVNKWLPLLDEKHSPIGSKIHVTVQFINATQHPNWSKGIESPKFGGVPYTYFKQKQGCKLSLYQDAHVSDNFRPKIKLSDGTQYVPQRCWKDISDALVNAKYLIYIAGWSIYTNITLIRDPSKPENLTLGELLKRKAEEKDMRVLILVWDDITSKKWLRKTFHESFSLMGTHDEDTIAYFQNSKVRCVRCPRIPDKGRSVIQGVSSEAVFTHHQKTLVVDCENGGGSKSRRIVSFVGGIDLCDGRYDTQQHSLFRTLNTVHKNDFHQPNFPRSSAQKGGPREPWHDIHCRLEGSIAWDVLTNFEQRWKKQVGQRFLYSQGELDKRITKPQAMPIEESESWNVQIFRSIDGGSVVDFPSDPHKAAECGLVSDKGSTIDHSIQDAYVNAIRRAKNFIYIENQYFIGSSYAWKPAEKAEEIAAALHLIPKELSLKIVSKIEAGERFSVYIVIPMWPEGEPESAIVQDILYYQRKTMEMMYTDIATAIKHKKVNAHPRDYLSFFCLGNREVVKPGEYVPVDTPETNSDYLKAQQSRRFMIYVHAKMLIVDDEYIIIGSANINQRSMDGARDTEIAMGAYQPHHLSARESARGHIYGFRMSLWHEHLSQSDKSFNSPESPECMRRVNQIAEQHWKIYCSKDFNRDLPGHILRYPVEVTKDGQITTLSDAEQCFPDTKATILGSKSRDLPIPPILTA